VSRVQEELKVFQGLDFSLPPVAVKFTLSKPEGIEKLDKAMALCEMIREAQDRRVPFYATRDNENCVGSIPLGWEDIHPFAEAGLIGQRWGIFEEPRANSRVYIDVPKFSKGVVNYVVFATLDNLTFDPDLLFVLASPSQAEIVLRAMTYSTGELYESKTANVLACAWLFAYPFRSGKVNFITTGLGFGMKGRQVYPEGQVLITIPFNWIPIITRNLQQMQWVLPAYNLGKEKFMQAAIKLHEDLQREMEQNA
jgi:uncharacterized protein (DUF169 family)